MINQKPLNQKLKEYLKTAVNQFFYFCDTYMYAATEYERISILLTISVSFSRRICASWLLLNSNYGKLFENCKCNS